MTLWDDFEHGDFTYTILIHRMENGALETYIDGIHYRHIYASLKTPVEVELAQLRDIISAGAIRLRENWDNTDHTDRYYWETASNLTWPIPSGFRPTWRYE